MSLTKGVLKNLKEIRTILDFLLRCEYEKDLRCEYEKDPTDKTFEQWTFEQWKKNRGLPRSAQNG